MRGFDPRLASVLRTTGLMLALFIVTVPMASANDVIVHGFASQGYLRSSDNNFLANTSNGSAEYQEFAFNITSQINDDLRVGVQFFARDLGPLGNNEIELDWAFGDYHWQDQLGFRVGRFKMPYGFYNETADFDAARTSVLLPTGVYDTRFRDLLVAVSGVQTYGNLNFSDQIIGGIDYAAFYGTANIPDGGSVNRAFDNMSPTVMQFDNLEVDFVAGGSLTWSTPLDGLRIGQTLTHYSHEFQMDVIDPALAGMLDAMGSPPELRFTSKDSNFLVSSLEYTWSDFVFAAERSLWKGTFNEPVTGGQELNREAWYVQGSYRVNEWFEVGSYYSMFYGDADDKDRDDPSSYQQDITLSTRFDVSQAMTVKFETHFIEGFGQLLPDINPGLMGVGDAPSENWTMFAAKTSFVF